MNAVKRVLNGLGALAVLSATPGCGPTTCVARGSRIRTKSGPLAVETLQVGDLLECVDPATGERVFAPLTAIHSSWRECVSVSIGEALLRCTSDHPLYCPDTSVFADAGDWVLGKRTALLFVDETSVQKTQVSAVAIDAGMDEVFDLSVDHPLHNFVANGVLVHNKSYVRCEEYVAGPGDRTVCGSVSCDAGSERFIACEGQQFGSGVCVCRPVSPDAGSRDGGLPGDGGTDAGP